MKVAELNLPAHAGVILPWPMAEEVFEEPTRTRGGDPVIAIVGYITPQTYPHTRG